MRRKGFLASVNYEVTEDTKDSRMVIFRIQEFEKSELKKSHFSETPLSMMAL